MNFGLFSAIMANVSFGTVVLALLGVFAALVGVEVARKGAGLILKSVGGGRHYINGRFYDDDVVDSALASMRRYKKAGGALSRDDARLYRRLANGRARRAL